MHNDEKQLIENLFVRLYQTEIKTGERDSIAEKLIKDLLEKYPNSPYYMAQTILIQETAIKKLNEKISTSDSTLVKDQDNEKKSSSSFLSNLFGSKKAHSTADLSAGNNMNQLYSPSQNASLNSSSSYTRSGSVPTVGASNNTSSFLSGALQTATGVAGGVVMANALMNLFQNKKPEEEIMDTTHNVNSSYLEPHASNSDPIHSQYVSGEEDNTDNDSEDAHQSHYDTDDNNSCDTFDDDNFI
ncbi:MAG: DUF2076 domain-containing protein [Buchnera aphidicola (Schlechtendalia peitan)]